MKIVSTRHGQFTARSIFNYLVLCAVCFYVGYERNADLRSTGGLIVLSILAVFGSLILGLLLFSSYEETVLQQAQQIDRQAEQIAQLQAKKSQDGIADEKRSRISSIEKDLELILRPDEIGPYGYSFTKLRQMATMSEQGANVDEIGQALGMNADMVRFLLSVVALIQGKPDLFTATQEAAREYDRLQEKYPPR